MFGFIKDKVQKIYTSVTQKVTSIVARGALDEVFLQELSQVLLAADTGVKTTNDIINRLATGIKANTITTSEQATDALASMLLAHLSQTHDPDLLPRIVLLVGINGSGKTTFIGKYAHMLKSMNKKVLVVAGDTFRAAAVQQLSEWAKRVGVTVFIGKENQDSAAVIFDACKMFHDGGFDHLIIDTAGRLQTKINLMNELEKIKRIIQKQLPAESIHTWLTIDAMLGQNSIAQAKVFHEATSVNGLLLTKLDGTGKGGMIFAITQELKLPIVYITFGEAQEDIKAFNAQEYVQGLLYKA